MTVIENPEGSYYIEEVVSESSLWTSQSGDPTQMPPFFRLFRLDVYLKTDQPIFIKIIYIKANWKLLLAGPVAKLIYLNIFFDDVNIQNNFLRYSGLTQSLCVHALKGPLDRTRSIQIVL